MAEKGDLLSILAEIVKRVDEARDTALSLDDPAEVAQLKEALETRGEIGKAQGILMERYGLDGDAAFQALVRLSQHTNRKLRDVSTRWSTPASSRTIPSSVDVVPDPLAQVRDHRGARSSLNRRPPPVEVPPWVLSGVRGTGPGGIGRVVARRGRSYVVRVARRSARRPATAVDPTVSVSTAALTTA
jgi:hypothetical protein